MYELPRHKLSGSKLKRDHSNAAYFDEIISCAWIFPSCRLEPFSILCSSWIPFLHGCYDFLKLIQQRSDICCWHHKSWNSATACTFSELFFRCCVAIRLQFCSATVTRSFSLVHALLQMRGDLVFVAI